MNFKFRSLKKEKGVGLIEIIIVGAILAIAFVGIVSFLINSRGITFQNTRNTEATFLAKEAMEAVRSIRDESWATNLATLTSGTIYYPVISGNEWTLATTDPVPINSLYTRTVV